MLRFLIVVTAFAAGWMMNIERDTLDLFAANPTGSVPPTRQPMPQEPPPLHREQTAFNTLEVWEDELPGGIRAANGQLVNGPDGKPLIAIRHKYRKFHQNGVLYGIQLVEHDAHFLDDFQMLPLGVNPWDSLAVAGRSRPTTCDRNH